MSRAETGSTLYNVQLNTGVATAIGTIGTAERVRSLTYAKAPTATLWGLTSAGHLVSFTLQDPATFVTDTAVTGLQGGESLVAIDVRPADGQLYGLTSAGRLVPVDPTTGAAGAGITLTANPADTAAPVYAGLSGTRFGMDFQAFDDLLRIHSNTGQSLRVITADGTVSQDTDLQAPVGLAPPQVIGTAYGNNYVGGASTVSYVVDAGNNRVMRHSSIAGTMDFIGAATGVDIVAGGIQAEGDIDIAGGENGLMLAALLPTGATQSSSVSHCPGHWGGRGVECHRPGRYRPHGLRHPAAMTTVIRDIAVRSQ